jgi:hypothetical protein
MRGLAVMALGSRRAGLAVSGAVSSVVAGRPWSAGRCSRGRGRVGAHEVPLAGAHAMGPVRCLAGFGVRIPTRSRKRLPYPSRGEACRSAVRWIWCVPAVFGWRGCNGIHRLGPCKRSISDRVSRPPASSASTARSLRTRRLPCETQCGNTPKAKPGYGLPTPPVGRARPS